MAMTPEQRNNALNARIVQLDPEFHKEATPFIGWYQIRHALPIMSHEVRTDGVVKAFIPEYEFKLDTSSPQFAVLGFALQAGMLGAEQELFPLSDTQQNNRTVAIYNVYRSYLNVELDNKELEGVLKQIYEIGYLIGYEITRLAGAPSRLAWIINDATAARQKNFRTREDNTDEDIETIAEIDHLMAAVLCLIPAKRRS